MILVIDTTEKDLIIVSFVDKNIKHQKRIKAPRQQAEKLLPQIVKIMQKLDIVWDDLREIKVQSEGGSFSSLRIGVLTANALAYALNIPIRAINGDKSISFSGGLVVKPNYQSAPNIGSPRNFAC